MGRWAVPAAALAAALLAPPDARADARDLQALPGARPDEPDLQALSRPDPVDRLRALDVAVRDPGLPLARRLALQLEALRLERRLRHGLRDVRRERVEHALLERGDADALRRYRTRERRLDRTDALLDELDAQRAQRGRFDRGAERAARIRDLERARDAVAFERRLRLIRQARQLRAPRPDRPRPQRVRGSLGR